jgi:hypothetical protein
MHAVYLVTPRKKFLLAVFPSISSAYEYRPRGMDGQPYSDEEMRNVRVAPWIPPLPEMAGAPREVQKAVREILEHVQEMAFLPNERVAAGWLKETVSVILGVLVPEPKPEDPTED